MTHRFARLRRFRFNLPQRIAAGLLLLALRAMTGRLVHGRDLDQWHATSLEIASRHAQVEVARDGEVDAFDTPLRYRIRPRALQVIAPAAGGSR